ncbi:MAG TPA: TIGR01777 family oxidoreductase [Acidobacteriota bacterium]|nr:TIGR01777 family oxidoreductase [Acidobacteriota bacterium]
MRIFVTGGTGFIGSRLIDRLAHDGHEILVLSRSSRSSPDLARNIAYVRGDPTRPGPWQEEVRTCGAAVNLAGASIFHRWTKEWKRAILESRVATTRNLVDAIGSSPGPPPILISTSAVGYYGPRGDEELGEDAAPGSAFLAEVTSAWETEALRAEKAGARTAVLRFGIVLGKGEGALGTWVPLFKACLGGPVGNGRQWFSWIHVDDLIEVIVTALFDPAMRGPVNACAPNPVRNRDLAKALGKALHRPSFFAVPGFAVRVVLGEFAESLLTGQRVVPTKLQARGFAFRHPTIEEALRAIVDGPEG